MIRYNKEKERDFTQLTLTFIYLLFIFLSFFVQYDNRHFYTELYKLSFLPDKDQIDPVG